MSQETFRVRFRFRLAKPLSINEPEHGFELAGKTVVVRAQKPESPIAESDWLLMNIRGFESEADAMSFGHKLRNAVELSSVASRLGVDAGRDLATGRFSQMIKDKIRESDGSIVRDSVHGVDVFPDTPSVVFFSMEGRGGVKVQPDPFLADLSRLFDQTEKATEQTRDIILLLNYALMRPEPVAQIIFSVSAVEMLGQQENWSAGQKQLLNRLATEAQVHRKELRTSGERWPMLSSGACIKSDCGKVFCDCWPI